MICVMNTKHTSMRDSCLMMIINEIVDILTTIAGIMLII